MGTTQTREKLSEQDWNVLQGIKQTMEYRGYHKGNPEKVKTQCDDVLDKIFQDCDYEGAIPKLKGTKTFVHCMDEIKEAPYMKSKNFPSYKDCKDSPK